MGADEFEDIYDQRCEYKSEVVKYLESMVRCLTSPISISVPDKSLHKQIYMVEDALYQIRMGLMELVWDQAGEVLIASEVVKLETITLAEWADRLYSAAKRVEKDAMLRKNTKNADHYLNIANKINETVLGARKKNYKSHDEVNEENAETSPVARLGPR